MVRTTCLLLRIRRSADERRWGTTVSPLPRQATFMADDKPEPTPNEGNGGEDEFMATGVLRHLRTGQGNPLEELGLEKAAGRDSALAAGYPRFRSTGPIVAARCRIKQLRLRGVCTG